MTSKTKTIQVLHSIQNGTYRNTKTNQATLQEILRETTATISSQQAQLSQMEQLRTYATNRNQLVEALKIVAVESAANIGQLQAALAELQKREQS